jgi:hypothetical protein
MKSSTVLDYRCNNKFYTNYLLLNITNMAVMRSLKVCLMTFRHKKSVLMEILH